MPPDALALASAPAVPVSTPSAAPVSQAVPLGGGAPSGQDVPSESPSQAQPSAEQVKERFDASPHLDKYLTAPPKPTADKFLQEGQQWSADHTQRYQDALSEHQRVAAFQDSIRRVVNSPLSVGDVTIAFTNEAEVHSFIAATRNILSNGPTAEQLIQLHFLPKLLQLAGDTAVRKYEARIRQAQPQTSTPVSPSQQQVVTPATPQARPTSDPFGRVPSSRELHKALDPQGFEAVKAGRASLFDQNR